MIIKNRERLLNILKTLISLIIVFYIVKYIISNISSLKDFKLQINYCYLTLSFIILLFYIFNQFLLWYYITRQNNCSLTFSKSIISRAYSEFGKYVPGKVFGYAILFYIYSKENHSKILLSFSMFFEFLSSILSAALIFLFSISFTNVHEFQRYRLVSILIMAGFLIIIHPKILNYFSSWFLTLIKRNPVRLDISYVKLLKIIALYILNFLILGFAFILFIKSIYTISFSGYLYITGSIAAAGLIGLFAVFVPAGLGVREGVLVFTLSIIMAPAFAGIIALLSRLWMTFAEIILFGFISLFAKATKINQLIPDNNLILGHKE
jgi:glycosyltransferase 2 family protein